MSDDEALKALEERIAGNEQRDLEFQEEVRRRLTPSEDKLNWNPEKTMANGYAETAAAREAKRQGATQGGEEE
jgi:hypothetical protein